MSISTSSFPLSLDHLQLPPNSEQLCYVHCNICDTVLAVSVPCTSLFKTVTVRCGHCANLLPVNMRCLQLLSTANQFHFGDSFYFPPPPPPLPPHSHLLEESSNPSSNAVINHLNYNQNECSLAGCRGLDDMTPKPPVTNQPPEKRQRVPSAYNRFIKEEIQRIKSVNPDISHREAFSAAAKNWAHFPRIHFGLMPDEQQAGKKAGIRHHPRDGVDDVLFMKDGFFASASVGISPY